MIKGSTRPLSLESHQEPPGREKNHLKAQPITGAPCIPCDSFSSSSEKLGSRNKLSCFWGYIVEDYIGEYYWGDSGDLDYSSTRQNSKLDRSVVASRMEIPPFWLQRYSG